MRCIKRCYDWASQVSTYFLILALVAELSGFLQKKTLKSKIGVGTTRPHTESFQNPCRRYLNLDLKVVGSHPGRAQTDFSVRKKLRALPLDRNGDGKYRVRLLACNVIFLTTANYVPNVMFERAHYALRHLQGFEGCNKFEALSVSVCLFVCLSVSS